MLWMAELVRWLSRTSSPLDPRGLSQNLTLSFALLDLGFAMAWDCALVLPSGSKKRKSFCFCCLMVAHSNETLGILEKFCNFRKTFDYFKKTLDF